MTEFTHRWATEADLEALHALMDRAIAQLQSDFLTPEQVAASHHVMGLDSQLVHDRTYLIIESGGVIAGCGGWSWRSTLYGGDASIVAREPHALDPATDAARIRAMYTNPDFTRRGIGRMILNICEAAARNHCFHKAEMMATLSGEPLYRACGYTPIEYIQSRPINGVTVPLIRMGKTIEEQ
jgi:GNAT superfamily N-acetyltransferase